MQKNTVSAGPYSFKVTKKQNKPFSNNFIVQSAKVVQYEGQDELEVVVKCTSDSKEPGMYYFCTYSTQGQLIACNN